MSERIAIDALMPGMVILQVTRQNGPVKIRKSGLVTSSAMVQGLAEMGVLELEIDPEQTVEIEAPVQYATQTQALLRGQHDTVANAKADNALSDQFNRSLFLPTVQGLPSVWKVHVRQAVLIALLVAGGFCIGFTAATPSRWWPALTQPQQSAVPATSVTQAVIQTPNTPLVSPQHAIESLPGKHPEVASPVAVDPSPESIEQSHAADVQATDDSSAEPATSAVTAKGSLNSRETAQFVEPNYGGEVLNDREKADVKVSPELLAKFNQAVEELDDRVVDNEKPSEVKVTVRDDMPRIDQLPVRLLTRLPSMSFSAHMYASRPADRWVRVNGKQLGEGDWINDDIQIVNIEAQRVILSFEEEVFSMAALTDW